LSVQGFIKLLKTHCYKGLASSLIFIVSVHQKLMTKQRAHPKAEKLAVMIG